MSTQRLAARSLAALLLATAAVTTAACGKIPDQAAGDGDGGNTAIDAGPPDARPPGPATVRVLDDSAQPIEGAMVIFTDPSGAVLPNGDHATDANGEATTVISTGDSIWVVIHGDRGARTIYSVLSAEPGDLIVFGSTQPFPVDQREITVAPPLAGQPPNTSLELVTGCEQRGVGGTAPPFTTMVNETCQVNNRYPFVFIANDNEGEVVGFAAGEGSTAGLSQATNWESAFEHVAVNYVNPITEGDGSAFPAGGIQWEEYFRAGRQPLLRGSLQVAPAPTQDTEYTQPKFIGRYGAAVIGVFVSQVSGEASQAVGRFVRFGSNLPDQVTIDGNTFMPFISGAQIDPATASLTWAENLRGGTRANLDKADFAEFWVRYADTDSGQVSWWVVMPTTMTSPVAIGVPTAVELKAPAGALPAITIVGDFDTKTWHDVRNTLPLPYFPEGSVLPEGEPGMQIAIDFQQLDN